MFLFISTTVFADTPPLTPQNANSVDPIKEKEIRSKIGLLQISFIKNESQIKDTRVKYYANTFAGTVFVTDKESVYGLKGWAIKEKFLNAKRTKAEGINAAETKVSYFKGSDQSNWKSNIPTYNEISLGEIYKNIRLNLKAYGKNIEKLFVVEKGGNPNEIAIKVEGAKGLKVNEQGELEIETGVETVKMTKPVAYQEIAGKKVEIPVHYSFLHHENNKYVALKVGSYNRDYPLVIDPLLASTFIGGSDGDSASALAIDSQGNVFVAGQTRSSGSPTTPGAYDTSFNGYDDVFVSKLNSSLTSLIASTFIGGGYDEYAYALAIDSQGRQCGF